jgi:predicted regulator of Ras-like GTPase activity (Roadblock/LC7/MglB family)
MNRSELKVQLDTIINNLAKISGVDGCLIVDGNSEILSHNILNDVDTDLFGPMAHVITSSSKRLINFTNQGELERVLIESRWGKALFLHLLNVNFIVLMNTKANVGMVMISSKNAAESIIELTQNLTPISLEEETLKISTKEKIVEKPLLSHKSDKTSETFPAESMHEIELTSKEFKTQPEIENQATEILDASLDVIKSSIPIIKPPIAFPKLEKVNKVPENEFERSELILTIYESILKAMSIGASKIMGVAPARGLTRKFLPTNEYKKLLYGVDVKNNSTIDFDKIRENAEKIPLSERENSFIDDFTKIIAIITENYGKVMGYSAFRGMVRPEFRIIKESYGVVINELKIKDKIHPELIDLF